MKLYICTPDGERPYLGPPTLTGLKSEMAKIKGKAWLEREKGESRETRYIPLHRAAMLLSIGELQ